MLLFSVILFLIGIFIVSGFNVPARFPQLYQTDFISHWPSESPVLARLFFLMKYNNGEVLIGLTFGLAFGLAVFIGNSRLFFYPFYLLVSFWECAFKKNPYIRDGVIKIPIPGLKRKLTNQAKMKPAQAVEFANFLLEFRPLQTKLAMHVYHAATAGAWEQHPLNGEILHEYIYKFISKGDVRKEFDSSFSEMFRRILNRSHRASTVKSSRQNIIKSKENLKN